jgi:hypothetical protein
VSDPTDPNDLIRLLNGEDPGARRARRDLADRLAAGGAGTPGALPSDEVLAAYLEGTLPEAERAAVDRTLAASAEARAHLEALSDLLRSSTAGTAVPADTLDEIMAMAPRPARPAPPADASSSRWHTLARRAAAFLTARWVAGAAVAVTAGVLAFWQPGYLLETGNPTAERRNEPDFRSNLPPTAPGKCDRSFAVVNRTARPISEVHLRLAPTSGQRAGADRDTEWGADLLAAGGLPAGQETTVTAAERGVYDLRIVRAGGPASERAHLDVCDVQRVIVTPDGLQVE